METGDNIGGRQLFSILICSRSLSLLTAGLAQTSAAETAIGAAGAVAVLIAAMYFLFR